MTANLPPSKFGAGYTFGEDPLVSRIPPKPVRPLSPAPEPAYSAAVSTPAMPFVGVPVAPAISASAGPVATGHLPALPASGGTAITAAVFALLMGLYSGFEAFGRFSLLALLSGASSYQGASSFNTYLTAVAVASAASALALIIGAILLLTRKSAGRGLIAVGCLIVIVETVVSAAAVYGFIKSFADGLGLQGSWSGDDVWYAVSVGVGLAGPLLTLILVLLGSTRRWCQPKSDQYRHLAPARYP